MLRLKNRDSRRAAVGVAGTAVAAAATVALDRPIDRLISRLSASTLSMLASAVVVAGIAAAFVLRRSWSSRTRAVAREMRTLREATLLLQNRAGELEMLMRLAESLGEALEPEALKLVILQHLQPFLAGHELWLSTKETGWQPIIGSRSLAARSGEFPPQDQTWHTFPLMSQHKLVGVLGVRHDVEPLTQAQRELLHAAAALLTVAVKNIQLFRKVRDLAVIEPLTGCVTRHHGIERLSTELRRAQRSHLPISVVMLDLDHFKSVNDTHGHLCGDQVLVGVGRILKETLRVSDERCRYGGEEFLLVLPDTTAEGASRVAENLRARFARTPVLCARGSVRFTASLGVAQAQPGESDVNALLARADAALYAAKASGRNRVSAQSGVLVSEPVRPLSAAPRPAIDRRDVHRPDRRQTPARGRRASDWQRTH